MSASFFDADAPRATLNDAHALFVQMHLSYDDQYMFSVGEDGTLLSFRLMDKEGRMLKREREANYAEEVLITRSDLEEKVRSENRSYGK